MNTETSDYMIISEDMRMMETLERQFSNLSDLCLRDFGFEREEKKPAIQPKKDISVQNCKHKTKISYWSEVELTILAGIALIYFAYRHSLKECRSNKRKRDPDEKLSLAWLDMHQIYEEARKRYNLIHKKNLPQRTAKALNKKWRDSGCKDKEVGEVFLSKPKSIKHLESFISVYNKNQILTCSKTRFQMLLKEKEEKTN